MDAIKPRKIKYKVLGSFVPKDFECRYGIALPDGVSAVAQDYSNRKLCRINLEKGILNYIDLGPLSEEFTRQRDEKEWISRQYEQRGALFNYKQGYGVIYHDMVVLFETFDAEMKVLPFRNPYPFIKNWGHPEPEAPLKACYNEQENRLYVVIDEIQYKNRTSFFTEVQLADGYADYLFHPRSFAFPNDPGDHLGTPNLPVVAAFGKFNNQLQLISSRPYDSVRLGSAQAKLYLHMLKADYTSGAIIQEIDTTYHNGNFLDGNKYYAWFNNQTKSSLAIMLHNLNTGELSRISLSGKDYAPYIDDIRGNKIASLQGNKLWLFSYGMIVCLELQEG
ncbi:MAG: hypothetical protein U0V74_03715 [Chitinophagales bacterium]